jgi:hypothetical protein
MGCAFAGGVVAAWLKRQDAKYAKRFLRRLGVGLVSEQGYQSWVTQFGETLRQVRGG